MIPTVGLRILRRRGDSVWSSVVTSIGRGSRPGGFYDYVDSVHEGGATLCSCDLRHDWLGPYFVDTLPLDAPVVHVLDGVEQPRHGWPLIAALLETRLRYFPPGTKNAELHWPHIDDAIALAGGGAPFAASWSLRRIERLRAALEAA